MVLTSQTLFTSPTSRHALYSTNTDPISPPKFPNFHISLKIKPFANRLHSNSIVTKFPYSQHHLASNSRRSLLRVFESETAVRAERFRNSDQDLENLLSVIEILCLASSSVLSIGLVLNWALSIWQKGFLGLLVNGVLAWQAVMVAVSVAVGVCIRRRQWRRLSSFPSKPGNPEINVLERIEKLEEGARSSATIVRVLSRQLEKLGIRFRVTRKTLKDPIAETAALAQKNSEATRALAAQEDILEKELGEIQKVLMAMQEQQQKQLELILAICKSGKLLERPKQGEERSKAHKLPGSVKETDPRRTQVTAKHKGTNNDKAEHL